MNDDMHVGLNALSLQLPQGRLAGGPGARNGGRPLLSAGLLPQGQCAPQDRSQRPLNMPQRLLQGRGTDTSPAPPSGQSPTDSDP